MIKKTDVTRLALSIIGYSEHMRLYEEANRISFCPFCGVKYRETFWRRYCPVPDQPRHSTIKIGTDCLPPGTTININGMGEQEIKPCDKTTAELIGG